MKKRNGQWIAVGGGYGRLAPFPVPWRVRGQRGYFFRRQGAEGIRKSGDHDDRDVGAASL